MVYVLLASFALNFGMSLFCIFTLHQHFTFPMLIAMLLNVAVCSQQVRGLRREFLVRRLAKNGDPYPHLTAHRMRDKKFDLMWMRFEAITKQNVPLDGDQKRRLQ